eukprot:1601759-Alexandrium_andersonii.AAC.1
MQPPCISDSASPHRTPNPCDLQPCKLALVSTPIQAHTTPICNMPRPPEPHPALGTHSHARTPRTRGTEIPRIPGRPRCHRRISEPIQRT